jgi:MFS family permease
MDLSIGPHAGQPRRRGWTLAIVSIGLFMVVLDNLVVNVALPSIHRDLGGSIQALEWTVNAYVLAYAVLIKSFSPACRGVLCTRGRGRACGLSTP